MSIQYNNAKIVTNGLVLHLDAANLNSYPGTGNTWYDISQNNKHFNWVSSPSTGVDNGIKYFTTLGNRCIGPASNTFGIDNTSGYTIFLVSKQNTLTDNHAFKFYKTGVGTATRGIASHCINVSGILYLDQGGCCNADTRINVTDGNGLSWNIWGFRSNITTRNIFRNGTSIALNTTTAANIDLNSTAVDLASSDEYGGNSSTWNARLASFVVYNRALTDAEVLQNFNAQRARFNL
jgi:hypothetical protein